MCSFCLVTIYIHIYIGLALPKLNPKLSDEFMYLDLLILVNQ